MPYRDNVQALCDRLDINNPIDESDLKVAALSLMINGEWLHIPGTQWNRAGRLFFEHQFPNSEKLGAFTLYSNNQRRGQEFFEENWLDPEEMNRQMLIAFKQASRVLLHWK